MRVAVKRALVTIVGFVVVLSALGYLAYVRNVTPVVPTISVTEAVRPYVVKMHARWCPVCMLTKGVWSDIDRTYAQRVNLVVFDFTDAATTDASRAVASRLGLEQFFDQYSYGTGTIVVLDGKTKEVLAAITGSRDFAAYRAAIEEALER
jgi:hypothetical protein